MPPKQERDQMQRDLLGYGGVWPDLTWPNGSRLAVSVVVNFEEGAERQVGDGDLESERICEVISVVAPGTRDIGQEQIFAYGMRAGLWRMLEALDRRRVPATFFACGQAVARVPALAAAVARAGHEMAVHGWRWRPHADYADRASEAADLDRCIEAISAATGIRPVGFFCRGSESAWTRDLLAGRGFAYTSNGFDDDLPYWDPVTGGRLLVVPYALDSNDMKFFHPNGFVRAREMVDYAADALSTLLDEARAGKPRLLNLGFHLRIAGRPARFPAFAGILDMLAARRDEIWIATRAEIAAAFAAREPGPGGASD
jgi:peptidoglycan/xylan/chitin deacetylase (PgdA/CDA1 family)